MGDLHCEMNEGESIRFGVSDVPLCVRFAL
jgi:hypothetical protein